MTKFLPYIIDEEHFILAQERTLFWEEHRILILADLHIGKTGHFRKSGINIPQSIYKDDLHRLLAQILYFKAERLIIVGDLTHSHANSEMNLFRKWRKDFPLLKVDLVKGNHDILDDKWYEEADIHVHNDPLIIQQFSFVHDITQYKEANTGGSFSFSGHVHPVIVMKGKGKQSMRLPCFYFTEKYCILPAFSRFTGGYSISPGKTDNIFAITENEIIPLR
jgi:DNA ligase-associated metallophosphoesterase